MTESVSALLAARKDLDSARDRVNDAAKAALHDVLTDAFSNPEVHEISWGQKNSEYNDEGMYPGVHGPYVSGKEDEEMDWEHPAYRWVLGFEYGNKNPTEPAFREEEQSVKAVLEAIGEEVLCDVLGYDEYVVSAYRSGDGFKLTQEYAGV